MVFRPNPVSCNIQLKRTDSNSTVSQFLLYVSINVADNFSFASTSLTHWNMLGARWSALVPYIYVQMCMHMMLDVLFRKFRVLKHDYCILSCVGGTFLKFHYLNILMRINSTRTYYSTQLECLLFCWRSSFQLHCSILWVMFSWGEGTDFMWWLAF